MIFLNRLYYFAHKSGLIFCQSKLHFFPLLLYCHSIYVTFNKYSLMSFFQARKPSGPLSMEDALFSGNSVEDHSHLVTRLGSARVSSKTTDTRPLSK